MLFRREMAGQREQSIRKLEAVLQNAKIRGPQRSLGIKSGLPTTQWGRQSASSERRTVVMLEAHERGRWQYRQSLRVDLVYSTSGTVS